MTPDDWLRYYAGQALAGLLARGLNTGTQPSPHVAAAQSWHYAEAMAAEAQQYFYRRNLQRSKEHKL